MKLFVSWSGEYSRKIAAVLKQWIPAVLQSVEVFYSPEDIEKGDDWSSRLNQELEECKYGIVCLTPENVKAPWINFEAGALAKTMDSRVSTLMLGIETSDVKGPLSRFQNTRFEKDDFKKLVLSINRNTDTPLELGVLDYIFENMWPHLQAPLTAIEKELKTHFSDGTAMTESERKENDALQEMLHILRKMDQKADNKYITCVNTSHLNPAVAWKENTPTLVFSPSQVDQISKTYEYMEKYIQNMRNQQNKQEQGTSSLPSASKDGE